MNVIFISIIRFKAKHMRGNLVFWTDDREGKMNNCRLKCACWLLLILWRHIKWGTLIYLPTVQCYIILPVLQLSAIMAIPLKKILVSDAVDNTCVDLLRKYGLEVTCRYKMTKEELIQEIQVSYVNLYNLSSN